MDSADKEKQNSKTVDDAKATDNSKKADKADNAKATVASDNVKDTNTSKKADDSKQTDGGKTTNKPADKPAEKPVETDQKENADKPVEKPEKPTEEVKDDTKEKPKTEPVVTAGTDPVRYEDPAGSKNMEDKIIKRDENGKFDYTDSETYVTQKGDTLFNIAQEKHVAMQQLRYYNDLPIDTDKLPIGIEIHIPSNFVDVPVGQ